MNSRRTLGGLVATVLAIGLGSLLAGSAPAAPPTLALTATDAVVGQTIHATAQLSESPGASGEISFEVFGPADPTCAGPALTPAPAPVAVSGEAQYVSGEFTPPAPGAYHWSAHYSGDIGNAPAEAICAAISTVGKASPGIAGSASSGAINTKIHDEVTLSGGSSPSGQVTFSVYGPADVSCSTPLETAAVTLAGGQATSAEFLAQQAGEFRWTAAYAGDPDNEPVELACGAANQASIVSKAAPTLTGVATSAVTVGLTITDTATLAGGVGPGGLLTFRAYGPEDAACAGAPRYEEAVAVSGNGPYVPAGFAPAPGLYLWTVEYGGDANNEVASSACGAANQASAVGTIPVSLDVSATNGRVGEQIVAAATIEKGAIPTGQITFKAFPPDDSKCSGAPAFSSTIAVAGNGTYRSTAFLPSRVGAFRWTVIYSGDPNHTPAAAACGKATSNVSEAKPSIAGAVKRQLSVGRAFKDWTTLKEGHAPSGTIKFEIFGPGETGCDKPLFVDTVAARDNGTVSSDPFVARRPGRYRFVASYSGDAANLAATEPCGAPEQETIVQKRAPKLQPRGLVVSARLISIRAILSGAFTPSGAINFRLYAPGDRLCKGKPAFSGTITAKSNGGYSLAQYLATKSGVYRLSVGYSGDARNLRSVASCAAAQPIRVG